jgi:hypothetical protein
VIKIEKELEDKIFENPQDKVAIIFKRDIDIFKDLTKHDYKYTIIIRARDFTHMQHRIKRQAQNLEKLRLELLQEAEKLATEPQTNYKHEK